MCYYDRRSSREVLLYSYRKWGRIGDGAGSNRWLNQSVSHQKRDQQVLFLFTVAHAHSSQCCSKYSTLLPESASGGADEAPPAGPTRHRHLLLLLLLCSAHPPAPATNPPPSPSSTPLKAEPSQSKGGRPAEPQDEKEASGSSEKPTPPSNPPIPFPSLPPHLLLRVSFFPHPHLPSPFAACRPRALRSCIAPGAGSCQSSAAVAAKAEAADTGTAAEDGMTLRRVASASAPVPDWLEALLATRFFLACAAHPASPRNECNMFCLDCRGAPPPAFCYYCRAHRHSAHRVIQIRRSSYHDVVRVTEVEDVLDISGVQTYVINSARVLFLNERPQPRGAGAAAGKAAASPYNCEICGRALLDPFRFCSLGCKLVDTKRSNGHAAADTDGGAANGNDEAAEPGGSKNVPAGARPQGRRRKGTPHRAPFWS